MTRFISIGGVSIITMVLGIFVFILWQILPLFRTAQVEEMNAISLEKRPYRILGIDDYGELPFLVDDQGRIMFVDTVGDRGVIMADAGFPAAKELTAFTYNPARQEIVYGTSDGYFSVVAVGYTAAFREGRREMNAEPEAGPFYRIGKEGHPIRQIAYGDRGEYKLAAVLQEVEGNIEIHAASLTQESTLFGAGEIKVNETSELTSLVKGTPEQILVNSRADSIVVSTEEGEVFYLHRSGDVYELRQRFRPFAGASEPGIASINYLFGDVTLVLTSREGLNRLFSLYVPKGGNERVFGLTKEFPQLERGASFYSLSQRNKAFLIGAGNQASLRYGTTEQVRWEAELPYEVTLGRIGGKYNRLALVDSEHHLHLFRVNDPHPEASFRAMFGRVWYEGASAPKFEWQSTGGSDNFEPKLSLVPLIVGTMKGTIYAMVFAVPIALLAAIYTSQFAHPHFRVVFKPVMEIMASLPSVVLGFLAALWLAPVLETRVPSVLLMIVFLPLGAMLFGWFWSSLPIRYRTLIRPGYEFIAFAPLFLVGVYLCWELGPVLERQFFVVTNQATGEQVADFRLWWPQATGTDFQQRNSLVVGFAMGFAVIPIIFTIAEDSLTNVPATLRSGSLALGASRWQTAIRIILPTASAGIFSALMVGLGRAVGETMIVVMATGNTPIMDLNIFSGMRTLSANIAVELPEAPHHGTLYRTLFLGAMVLFMLTFLINTLAEVLRQSLRERYKIV